MEEFTLVKKIFNLTKPFHKVYVVMSALVLGVSVLGLLAPLFFGKLIDSLIESHLPDIYLFTGLAIFFWFLHSFIDYIAEHVEISRLAFRLQEFFSVYSIEKVLHLSLGQFRNENSGYRQKIFRDGETAMIRVMEIMTYHLGPIILSTIVTIVALFLLNSILAIIILLGVSLYIVATIYINVLVRPKLAHMKELWGKNGREHSEILRYLGLVKLNSQEKKVTNDFAESWDELSSTGESTWGRYVFQAFGCDAISVTTRSAALAVGVYFAVQGNMTTGELVTFFAWAGIVFVNLNHIGFFQRIFVENLSHIKKFFEILETPSDIIESEKPYNPKNFKGKIEFKNVSFAYTPKEEKEDEKDEKTKIKKKKEDKKKKPQTVLKNVSFSINPGETCAFVGRSGSGKTTTVNLLLRAFDPNKGNILIDDVNLKEVGLSNFHKKVGIVEQDVELFDRSIGFNILFSIDNPKKVTKAQREKISKDSGISEFADRLTDGWDTIVGEKGVQLSGGQKQRVGIARALAKNPDILIFDEATSSLDSVTETHIRKAMKKALKGRTGIVIAHRLATVRDADKIVMMEKGKVVGIGTHEELMEGCTQYQRLVKLQDLH